MANQTGRPIAPARKLVAAVLGVVAVFVMVFGLGYSSWPIVALGAALLALAIALGMVNVVRRGARAWVAGHGQVKAISEPPGSGAYGRAELQVVVVAPGLPVTEVLVRDPRVPVGKWPRPGETLPITVDVDDMRRIKIDWSGVDDRNDDGDPPPPAFEQPEEFLDDDLLGDPEPPPWATRDRSWGRGPDEPPPSSSPAADYPEFAEEQRHPGTVVVHETPAGPILEGQLVDQPETKVLPQRAPRPSPSASEPTSASASEPTSASASAPASAEARASADDYEPARAEAAAGSSAAASATMFDDEPSPEPSSSEPDPKAPIPPSAGRRPSPRPRKSPEPNTEKDLFSGTRHHSPDATPGPAMPQPGVLPGQRNGGDTGHDSPPPESPASETTPADHDIDLPLDSSSPTGTAPRPSSVTAPSALNVTAFSASTGTAPTDTPSRDKASTGTDPTGTDRTGMAGDPEPVPEFQPEVRSALNDDVIAPPADSDLPVAGRAWVAGSTAATPPTQVPGPSRVPSESESPAEAEARTEPPAATRTRRPWEASMAARDAEAAAPSAPPVITGVDVPAPDAEQDESPSGSPWADLEGSGYEPDERADDLITAYPSARPGPAGSIHGVGITVLVTDLERSTDFYRDTLGFHQIDNGPGSAVLASGDTRLVLRTVHSLAPDIGRLIYLNLEVGDVDAIYDELKAKGVKFLHGPRPVNRGEKLELWAATFYDPDGHNIAITQWRAIR